MKSNVARVAGAAAGTVAAMRRPITSRVHGMLDYAVGVVLVVSPWLFGFSDVGGAAVAVPMVVGALVLLQSLMTDYELSVENALPLPVHLAADVVAGAFLAASPWLFGFADEGVAAWLPHLLIGVGMVAVALLTVPERAGGAVVTRDVRHHGSPYTG